MPAQSRLYTSKVFRDVAAVIGEAATLKLCQALGGTRIYVPAKIGEHHPIGAALGMADAAKIAEHYHQTTLLLPKPPSRRERVIEMHSAGTMTIREIALACDYSETQVYAILKDQRGGQLDLFNSRIG